jgi:hypothetical protein
MLTRRESIMNTALIRTTARHCRRCGGTIAPDAQSPAPLTPDELAAVAHGWNIESYRWVTAKLKTSGTGEPRQAATNDVIPSAPDQHELVRQRVAGTPSIRSASRQRPAGTDPDAIPPAPLQDTFIGEARRAPGAIAGIHGAPHSTPRLAADGIPPAPIVDAHYLARAVGR